MSKFRKKRKTPKRVLALPDLEQAKSAVLNTLTSKSGQRTYDHAIREFVSWYCSEPRLAFNRTVVLRYRIHLEQRHYAPATINLRLAAIRRVVSCDSDVRIRRRCDSSQVLVAELHELVAADEDDGGDRRATQLLQLNDLH